MNFDGIGPEAFLLLAQNRFEDSKEFYETHKAELKRLAITPMGQIAECLAPDLAKLDPQMLLTPSRVVSRIRRDTRYTRDKQMYRSKVWVHFSRPRVEYPHIWPVFWFEIKPEEGVWDAGVSVWEQTPDFMRFLRKRVLQRQDEFLEATEQADAAGARLHTDPYKKDRAPDAPEALKPYLNAKSYFLMVTSDDMALLENEEILERLGEIYGAYAALYRWYQQAAEDYISLQE